MDAKHAVLISCENVVIIQSSGLVHDSWSMIKELSLSLYLSKGQSTSNICHVVPFQSWIYCTSPMMSFDLILTWDIYTVIEFKSQCQQDVCLLILTCISVNGSSSVALLEDWCFSLPNTWCNWFPRPRIILLNGALQFASSCLSDNI